jgi:hypothetical protein
MDSVCEMCGLPLDNSGDGFGPDPIPVGSGDSKVCGMRCLHEYGNKITLDRLERSDALLDATREALGIEPGEPIVAPSQRETAVRWERR